MSTYIYLNEYKHGYLYVGSHTWKGPEGVLDPFYKGSSWVAKRYGWSPERTTILEVITEDKKYLHREKFWIELYARLVGIADAALVFNKNAWNSKYAPHGRLLNCHSNDASHACEAARSKEARRKQVESTDYAKRSLNTDWISRSKNIDYKANQKLRLEHVDHKSLQEKRSSHARQVQIFKGDEKVYEGPVTGAKLMFGDSVKHPFQKSFITGCYIPTCGAYKGYIFKALKETTWKYE